MSLEIKNKSVLVTGANGLLGHNLLRELCDRKCNVVALVEKNSNIEMISNLDVKIVYGDVLDKSQMIDLTNDAINVVIHCAAITNLWPKKSSVMNRVNIEGTQNVIDACLINDIDRLIYVGTANSFSSGPIYNPGTEVNLYTANKYGLDYMDSKRKAQELVLDSVRMKGLNAVVVNPTFMIGPYDTKPSSGAMIQALYKGKLPGYTTGGKNFICVKDAAVGVANAMTLGRNGECYILGNQNLTFNEMFRTISDTINCKFPKLKVPAFLIRTYGLFNSFIGNMFNRVPTVSYEVAVLSCEYHYYSSKKSVEELMLPQTPIQHGILDCFQWFKENNYV